MKKIELTLQNMRETVQSEKDKDSEAHLLYILIEF